MVFDDKGNEGGEGQSIAMIVVVRAMDSQMPTFLSDYRSVLIKLT